MHYRGQRVKRLRQGFSNQRLILDAFQAAGWPTQVENPLPRSADAGNRRERLHDTIKNLNRGHAVPLLRFHGTDAGRAVSWRGLV